MAIGLFIEKKTLHYFIVILHNCVITEISFCIHDVNYLSFIRARSHDLVTIFSIVVARATLKCMVLEHSIKVIVGFKLHVFPVKLEEICFSLYNLIENFGVIFCHFTVRSDAVCWT